MLEAILWLSDYPCFPPCLPPSSFTSSMGLIVNRSCLLSDPVWWWYRLWAMPPLPILSVGSNGFQMCPHCTKALSKSHQSSENRLYFKVFNVCLQVFPLSWELLVFIVSVGWKLHLLISWIDFSWQLRQQFIHKEHEVHLRALKKVVKVGFVNVLLLRSRLNFRTGA